MNELAAGWTKVLLSEVIEYNPKHPKDVSDLTPVSFVPMAVISESSAMIGEHEQRPLGQVRKGYTHFADGDVIIAKITPCFENGKAAIADNLVNGIGCGTTELHVLRPTGAVLKEYLYHYLHREGFRKEAKAHMTGTAGQLRVPSEYLKNLEIPLAPLNEQKRIVSKLEEIIPKIETCKLRLDKIAGTINVGKTRGLLDRMVDSVLAVAFRGELLPQDPTDEPASALLERIKSAAHLNNGKSKAVGGKTKIDRVWLEEKRGKVVVEDYEYHLDRGYC